MTINQLLIKFHSLPTMFIFCRKHQNYSSFPVGSTFHYLCNEKFTDRTNRTAHSLCENGETVREMFDVVKFHWLKLCCAIKIVGQRWNVSKLFCQPIPCTNISYVKNAIDNITIVSESSTTYDLQSTDLSRHISALEVGSTINYKCRSG